jgi:hypothetical protein
MIPRRCHDRRGSNALHCAVHDAGPLFFTLHLPIVAENGFSARVRHGGRHWDLIRLNFRINGKRLVSPAFSDTDGCAELETLKRSVRSSLRRC